MHIYQLRESGKSFCKEKQGTHCSVFYYFAYTDSTSLKAKTNMYSSSYIVYTAWHMFLSKSKFPLCFVSSVTILFQENE